MKYRVLACLFLLAGCGATPDGGQSEGVEKTTAAVANKDFDVEFDGCVVFAGIGLVPTAKARALVPAEYTLAGDAEHARIVVRVARCSGSVVDGKNTGPMIVSHIGIGLIGPDTTTSINNYTLWYATDNARLHAKLTALGVNADKTNSLSLTLNAGTLSVLSSSPHTPSFQVLGTAVPPTAAPIPTTGTWWDDGCHGTVRSRTPIPAIQFGTAHTVLTTPAGSPLAALIGGTSFTFSVLDSYNTFPTSPMQVTAQ